MTSMPQSVKPTVISIRTTDTQSVTFIVYKKSVGNNKHNSVLKRLENIHQNSDKYKRVR